MVAGTRNKVIKGGGTHHIAIQARDWDASLKLYRDVLGMAVVAEFGTPERKIVLLDLGDGSHVELFQPTDKLPPVSEKSDPYMHFALSTNDVNAAIEHVRQAGYEVTLEPKRMTLDTLEVTIAFFKGPSGEELEFVQVH